MGMVGAFGAELVELDWIGLDWAVKVVIQCVCVWK